MKTFPHVITKIVTLLACSQGCLATTLSAQQQQPAQENFQSRLSLMKEHEFHQWLVGTEWEYTHPDGTLSRYRFLTGRSVGWLEKPSGGFTAGYGYRPTKIKGQVEWYRNPNGLKQHRTVTVSENLSEAVLKGDGKTYPMKLLSRHAPPASVKLNADQFNDWIQPREFAPKSGRSKFTFKSGNKLVIEGRTTPISEQQYSIPHSGMIEFSWNGSPFDINLFILSQDLQIFEMLAWWGKSHGSVNVRLPVEKGKLTKNKSSISISDAAAIGVKAQHSAIHSLTVIDLGHSRMAGRISKLSASALKLVNPDPATLAFNQEVGEQMSRALGEVAKFIALRHNGWPVGSRIELSFADKYSPKDGPSAALASAIILEGLITGQALDTAVAITGDLNADGSVQPVGGVTAKLRGAAKAKMSMVIIPEKNRTSAVDLMKTEGVAPFLGPQIISAGTFDEAWILAATEKSASMQQGLILFATVARQLKDNETALTSAQTLQSLDKVCELIPNHISARLLLASARDQLPQRLSVAGSLEAIDQAVGDILEATGSDLSASGKLDTGKVGAAKTRLQRLRTLVDARLQTYVDAWINWATLADQIISRRSAPPPVVAQFKQASLKIAAERELLKNNVELHEELMQ